MSRITRKTSYNRCYHVIIRGVNKQNIFEDDGDRLYFCRILRTVKEETGTQILAYCLMNNHAHMLLRVRETIPDLFMQKLLCRYVAYFNKKYDRTGHLFQNRYISEAVDNEKYLLTVIRYIHHNPSKAGISSMENYPWSSYRDYLFSDSVSSVNMNDNFSSDIRIGLTDTDMVMKFFDSIEEFVAFMNCEPAADETDRIEHLGKRVINDDQAFKYIEELVPGGVFALSRMRPADRNKIITEIKKKHLSVNQISRITGISKNILYKIR